MKSLRSNFLGLCKLTRPSKIEMRFLLLLVFFLLVPTIYSQSVSQITVARNDRVVIRPRTILIVRHGKLIKDFPGKQRATIKYPLISGLSDGRVLRRVQSILQVKNVFDTSVAEYRDGNWLEEFTYNLNYNKNYILDITFEQSGLGAYPDTQTKHFAINLKNGAVIRVSDAFLPRKRNALFELVKGKFQAELKQILVDLRESRSDPEEIRVAKEAQEALEFEPSDIDDFSVGDKGVTFLYDAGYPHVIQAFEPEGRYFFSYAELKPYIKRDGPLGQFVD
jgi:hypothetical protein